jgi:hypothetical protein
MAIIRNQGIKIKVHRTEEELQADATGDLNLLYRIETGVLIDLYEPTELWAIEIFQDSVAKLVGLFVRK